MAVILTAPIVLITVLRKAKDRQWRDIGEQSVLWASTLLLPPVAAFSVYFALWHSPRHIIRTLPRLPANRRDPLAINQDASLANLRPDSWIGAFLATLTVPHAVAIYRYNLWLRRRCGTSVS